MTPDSEVGPSEGALRFYPLAIEFAGLIEQGRLNCAEWAVLAYLFVKSKRTDDSGVVWTCSTVLARTIPGLSEKRAKWALRELESHGFIKRFRQRGSRCTYPVVLDRYLTFRMDRQVLVVSARGTVDWRHPAISVQPRTDPRGDPRPAPRTGPRGGPPYPEGRTTNNEGKLSPPADESEGPRCTAPRPTTDAGVSTLDPAGLADLFARYLPACSQPRRPLTARISSILAAALQRERDRDWDATLRQAGSSAFLTGRKKDFRASLTWLVEPQSLAMLDGGTYDDHAGPQTLGAEPPPKIAAMHARFAAAGQRIKARTEGSGAPPRVEGAL